MKKGDLVIVKGENYTEVQKRNSTQYIALQRNRKPKDCGVWVNGVKIQDWEHMGEPFTVKQVYPQKLPCAKEEEKPQ